MESETRSGSLDDKLPVPILDESNHEEWDRMLLLRLMAYKWVYDKLTQGTTDFGMPSRYLDPPANTQRNPEYAGTDGESRFKIELEYAMKAKLDHETRLKNSTWALIFSRISIPLQNKITLKGDYAAKLADKDYVWLHQKAKEVATGEGAHSVCLEFIKLMQTKMTGNDWQSYFKAYTVAANKIKQRLKSMSPEQLINCALDAIFVIGIMSDPTQPKILQHEISSILKKQQWDSYSDLISRWSASLTSEHHINLLSNGTDNGEVKANVARARQGPTSKFGPMKCLNCGIPGHSYRLCQRSQARCSKCGGMHCDAMHDIAESIRSKRKPAADSPSAMLAQKFQGRKAYTAVEIEEMGEEAYYALQEEEITAMQAAVGDEGGGIDEGEYDDDTGDLKGYMVQIEDDDYSEDICTENDIFANRAHTASEDGVYAIFDTGASGHILQSADDCTHVVISIGRFLRGATNGKLPITHTAKHPILGHCNIVPDCKDNLISVTRMMNNGCKVVGEKKTFIVYNSSGEECMRAVVRYDGLPVVYLTDILAYVGAVTDTGTNMRTDGGVETIMPRIDVARPLMNAQDIKRAKEAREMHANVGHPGDEAFKHALNHGTWPNVVLTGRDVDNARMLYGVCPACAEGKITEAPNPSTGEIRAERVGDIIVYDLSELSEVSLGGSKWMLFGRDVFSSYVFIHGLVSKHHDKIRDAINGDIAFLVSHRHVVRNIFFDSEPTFRALKTQFPGISVDYSTPLQHNKRAERLKRELNEKFRTMNAGCMYILPKFLDLECYCAAGTTINTMPNDQTGPTQTPTQIVTGYRPVPRQFSYGAPVIAYGKRNDQPQVVGYWAVMLDIVLGTPNTYRVFDPQRRVCLNRKHVVPQPGYPSEWNFQRRFTIMPAKRELSVIDQVQHAEQQLPLMEQQVQLQSQPTVDQHTQQAVPVIQPAEMIQTHQVTPAPTELPVTPMQPVSTPVITAPVVTVQPEGARRGNALFDNPPVVLERRTRGNKLSYEHRMYEAIVENGMSAGDILAYVAAAGRISLRQALREGTDERKAIAKQAIMDEIKQLMDIEAFRFLSYDDIPAVHRNRIVPSHMFLKEKWKPDGSFDRMKARLVGGGNFVDPDSVGNTRAPTVNISNVRLMLAVAALRRYTIMTGDVKGAFLLVKVADEDVMYVVIEPEVAKIMVEMYPNLRRYLTNDGTIVVAIKVWLYGFPQSAEKFYSHLSATLLRRGFTVAPGDRCVFARGTGNDLLIVCTHVDDILCIGKRSVIDTWSKEIGREYDINIQIGHKHSYIGLDIKQEEDGTVRIAQTGYRRDILHRFSQELAIGPVVTKTPCTPELMIESDDDIPRADKHRYMSIIMSVMYLARLTRPDLLLTCAVLATHSQNPSEYHFELAARMLRYIRYSGNKAIIYRNCSPVDLRISMQADASHASHADGKGHMCVLTKFGSGIIDFECSKLKLVTLSSTESEHVALCAASKTAIWLRDMFKHLGLHHNGPMTIYQDNTSTIWLTANEGNHARNKHILVRRNYVKEAILDGHVKVLYRPTAEMAADMGTKPLPEKTLRRHMEYVGLVSVPDGTPGPSAAPPPTPAPVSVPTPTPALAQRATPGRVATVARQTSSSGISTTTGTASARQRVAAGHARRVAPNQGNRR